jgi:Ran GTPase-activating protein (RanGAP) involved in mRNA processing and transport
MMSSAVALEGPQNLKLHHEKEQLCCILASLMHKEVTTVHLPDFKFMWTKETGSKLKKLVQVIGAECPRLRCLDLKFSSPCALESRIGNTFFNALSRLVNLQSLKLNNVRCNNRTLQKIGQHCTNLV